MIDFESKNVFLKKVQIFKIYKNKNLFTKPGHICKFEGQIIIESMSWLLRLFISWVYQNFLFC